MYSTWTIPQLKKELRSRGASLKGRKADLVNRLECYDRNYNFSAALADENEDGQMLLPAVDMYHDINSSMLLPPLTKEHIRFYFMEFNKSPHEGLLLYENRYLNIIRAAIVDEHTFIKGFVNAAMKRVQYETNVKIHNSSSIEESMCECVAGSGTNAHCKHVAVTLFAVEHMLKENIILKHQVPTERLQGFHKPKSSFTASPIKANKLLIKKRKIENIIFSPCKINLNVEEYNTKVRNLVLNCPSNIPLKQLYNPVNPYGITLDHDYEKMSTADTILEQLYLLKVSADKAGTIEVATRGQSDNKQWFKHRECRITASIFHTVCSLKLVTQKKYSNQILNREEFNSRATTHGKVNEKVALDLYIQKYNLDVRQCGLFISTERPYLGASPDGLLGEDTIIEIKCPYTSRNKVINPITVPYLVCGKNGELELKKGSPYYFQVQGAMYCSQRKFCNFLVYTYKALEVVFVEYDEEFLQNYMLPKLDTFYFTCFKESVLNKYLYKDYLVLIKKTGRNIAKNKYIEEKKSGVLVQVK